MGEYRVIIGKLTLPDGSPLPDKNFDPMTTAVRQPAGVLQQSGGLGAPGESARRRRHDQLRSDDEAAAGKEVTRLFMDEIGKNAAARGLTPDGLESLLSDR